MRGSRELAARVEEIGEQTVKNASDPRLWGPAKSLMMSATNAGVDMEDERELNEFLALHNLRQLGPLIDEGERKPKIGRNDPCPCGSGM